ncbi:PQQ-binding-like beta-propeller repeat protein [Synoicihabitans lomoniglobus]|uniref:PQQ-binding-like beta-propeller repeat protein n=1 Tax=Synoicihabitans lomoniglobus TaxID=2909285 RepID=A0AAF0CI94_9BACT|nr:PQQ-binding-like beta-propeller repeat protein [Opitutaceae bacterium LMO-M01]WED65132.1 PQQ-binding-like beta-propeller repeat protein [Opitutaceae bacterium LMO-M01]
MSSRPRCFLFLLLCTGTVAAASHTTWSVQTLGPIRGSAVIEGDSIYFGSADGNLYAADPANGELRWKFETGGPIAGAPAVAGNTVVVAGRGETVHALQAHDGTPLWSFTMQPTLPTPTGWNYFTATPVIDGEQVLVGSGDGHLYALDLTTGALRWKFKTGDSLRATPLVVDGVVYQPSGDDHIYALAATDGTLQWKFATEGVDLDLSQGFIRSDIFTRPIVQDGLLIVGCRDGKVYAIDIATHAKVWDFSYGSTWAMSTTVADATVYVGWSTNNKVNALDLATGKLKWEAEAPAHTYTTGVILDDQIYWGCADGKLYGYNRTEGTLEWSYDTGADIYASAVYAHDRFFVGGDDGRLRAITARGPDTSKAVYLPAVVPDSIKGFVVDPTLVPYLTARGYTRLDSAAALTDWIATHTADTAPSVVVFGFAQIPTDLMGADPATGPLRAYLAAGGKVVWPWGMANKFTFDEQGAFDAYNPTTAGELLDVSFLGFEDSGNYYARPTQTGRNWGLPAWLKTTFASLQPGSYDDVTPLAFDEYGRVSAFLKSFHPRPASGWVSFSPTGFGVPLREAELATLARVAAYGLE